jgi:hypothetical protein
MTKRIIAAVLLALGLAASGGAAASAATAAPAAPATHFYV